MFQQGFSTKLQFFTQIIQKINKGLTKDSRRIDAGWT
jgi:hypothetical protein